MHIFIQKNKYIVLSLLMWALVGVGMFLRTYRADMFPIDNNDDGLYYVWTGTSFLSNPVEVHSHTIFDSSNTALLWRSQTWDYVPHLRFGMKIVEPWFDHPPLGSILIGLPAYFLGYTQVEEIPTMIVRYPALLASICTLLLTFYFSKRLFGTKTAFLSLLFIATTPYFVFAHRQSYLENFLTPIFLGSIVSSFNYFQTKNKYLLLVSALLAFLCGWIKIPAFGVPLMLAGWSAYKKDTKACLTYGVVFAISVLGYISYGFLTSQSFFLDTLLNQGVRGMYLSSFVISFVKPVFYGDFMDGLYILGLLSCCTLLLTKEKTEQEKFFAWFFVAWLLVLFLVSGKFNNSPWYRYPLIPFMSIGLAMYAVQLWEKKSLYIAALFLLFGFSGYDLAGIEMSSHILRLTTVVLFVPFLLYFLLPQQKLTKIATNFSIVSIFILILVGNILAIKQYPFERCTQEACLLPVKIILEQK